MNRLKTCFSTGLLALSLALVAPVHAQQPLKIGFGMSLTGPLAGNGKAALIAMQIWAEDVNAKGGILGRKVELVYYDDQTNPSTVPSIYNKLLDVDKVDLLVSGYGTNVIAPAMPIVMQRNMAFMGLFGLNVNSKFNYDRYFQIMPAGPEPAIGWTQGFFDTAMALNPKPQTVALVGADAEYPALALEGARAQVKRTGLKVVYDKTYPPNTVDFSPIMRAIQATNPDVVFVASYPPDSVGIVRSANEIGLKRKMFGGGMIGLAFTPIKAQLGALLNGIVAYDVYVPEPTMKFPGIDEFLKRYQEKAAAQGVDPLGYYLPPYAYSEMQILAEAVSKVGSLDQAKLADYIHKTAFKTIVGDVKFAHNGEWEKERVLFVQYQGVVGNDVNQFRQVGRQVILYPPEYKSGDFKYPYSDFKK